MATHEQRTSWRKGWQKDRPPCPECKTKLTTAYLNYPGRFVCSKGHRYNVPELVVPAWVRNPEAEGVQAAETTAKNRSQRPEED